MRDRCKGSFATGASINPGVVSGPRDPRNVQQNSGERENYCSFKSRIVKQPELRPVIPGTTAEMSILRKPFGVSLTFPNWEPNLFVFLRVRVFLEDTSWVRKILYVGKGSSKLRLFITLFFFIFFLLRSPTWHGQKPPPIVAISN